jgi:hypothetical protein
VRGGNRQQHQRIIAGPATEYLSLETAKLDGTGTADVERIGARNGFAGEQIGSSGAR